MGVTIKEVAKEAGVSIATVSRVFNNSGPVNSETRRRVEDAARTLRYTPNVAARSLITSRTQTLGVLLPDLYGEFFSEVIRGVDQTARRHRFHLLLSSSHSDRVEIEAALQAMHGRVDGLLVMSPDPDTQRLKANLPDSLPVLLLNSAIDDARLNLLNIDNVGGVRAMVRHLREHGHRRIAVIKGSARNFDASERLRGYRMAAQEDGGFWAEALEIPGDFTKSAGYAGARNVLAMTPRPTAIFAFNDSMAIGALSALRVTGVRVPEEMAVVGFDDIPMAQYVTPALTSVHVPIFEMGARAVERLIEALQRTEDAPGTCEVLPTTLVIRASCGLDHPPMSS